MINFSGINYLALLICTILSFVLGMAWYSPLLFGKLWQKEVGLKGEIKLNDMFLAFGGSLICMALMQFGLSIILKNSSTLVNWQVGLVYGLIVGLCFAASSILINNLYQEKSFLLWAIDAGYQVTYLAIGGIILGFSK